MLDVIPILFHGNGGILTTIDGVQNFYYPMFSCCLSAVPPPFYAKKHTYGRCCNRDLNYHFGLLVTKKIS